MPGNASQRRSVHPLSRTSRRRRRLASPGELPETDRIALADAPDLEFPRPAHRPTPELDHRFANTSPSRFTALLTSAEPRVWLLAGDTPGADDLAGALASQIRFELGRPDEIVIDAAFRGCTIASVRESLRHRILPRQPDAVILTVGPGDDAAADQAATDEFEEHLAWVLETLHAHEIAVAVVTAPLLDGPAYAPGALTMAAVRAITAELGALHVESAVPGTPATAAAKRLVSAITAG